MWPRKKHKSADGELPHTHLSEMFLVPDLPSPSEILLDTIIDWYAYAIVSCVSDEDKTSVKEKFKENLEAIRDLSNPATESIVESLNTLNGCNNV